jgi:hypothetical protein
MNGARAIAGLALFAVLLGPSVARGGGDGPPNWVVPGGQEARILSLVAPNVTLAPVLPGTWFDRIEITDDAIIFVVSGREPPAGPMEIRLSWDAGAPSDRTPPPWQLEVRGEADPGPLTESVALLRSRIEARLTPELYGGLLSYVADSGGDLAEEAPDWVERIAGTFGLVWRERGARGLIQYSLGDVDVTAPAAPPAWVLVALLALVAAGSAAGLRRVRRAPRPGAPAAWAPLLAFGVVGAALLATWWLRAPMSEAGIIVADHPDAVLRWLVPAHREAALAWVFLAAAVLATGAGLVDVLRAERRPGRVRVFVELGIVAGVSALVRGALVAPNLYSRGAGGFERLLRYVPGEGGLSLMISGILPGREDGFIWSAVGAATILAAWGPPVLYLLARALRLSAPVSLVAGVALACWPLHAMLSASDLLVAPVLVIGIGAWAFCAQAAATDRPRLLLPAAALLAFGVWCRLDGFVLLLPAAALLAGAAGRWRRRSELWLAGAWIGLAVFCRILGWPGTTGPAAWSAGEAFVALTASVHAVLPWWLIFMIPGVVATCGVPALRRPVLLGIVAAAVAVPLLGARGGAPWIEGGGLLLPWAALLCGLGADALGSRLPSGALRTALAVVVSVGVLGTPVLHRGELGAPRGPARTDLAFRAGLAGAGARCSILVTGEEGPLAADELRRYRLIAWEQFERNPDGPRGDHVVTGRAEEPRESACIRRFDVAAEEWEKGQENR